jgi:polyhydroxyalkanoate synthesis regulator protein
VPQFLATSFEMLRDSQSKLMENLGAMNPMNAVPGFEAMRKQQEAFLKQMMSGWKGASGPEPETADDEASPAAPADELSEIRRQVADLQKKLSKIGK